MRASRRPDVVEARLKLIAEAIPLTDDPAILEASVLTVESLATQLNTLRASITKFDFEIESLLNDHPDGVIFQSLPGAGPNMASRLLVAFGTDRERFPSAAAIQQFSGIAPVLKQSGNTHFVQRRFACPAFHRQSFLEWVGQTITKSYWARAFYEQQKAKGVKHYTALRALAYKWIRIIWRCWQDNTPYDEEKYIARLTLHQSPLIPAIKELQLAENKS